MPALEQDAMVHFLIFSPPQLFAEFSQLRSQTDEERLRNMEFSEAPGAWKHLETHCHTRDTNRGGLAMNSLRILLGIARNQTAVAVMTSGRYGGLWWSMVVEHPSFDI